ncbi:MAG: phospholipase D-like domain-containing protein [Ignavibacteriales bacterium]|nr:phospholipase D-like domain-containing protein [Ignavibacteriales bacterium]
MLARFSPRILLLASLSISSLLGQQSHVVISEVYGGGGNSGSTWKNDFVELYNPTNAPVNVTGWSVQYVPSTWTTVQTKTVLSGVIQPKSYFLIQEAQGAGGTRNLPTPDVIGTIAMAAGAARIALVKDTISITTPTDVSVIDFVGYGVSSMYRGSGSAPALTNSTSAERKASVSSTAATLAPGGSEEKAGNGFDTDDNANDFVVQSAINPQNSASPKEPPPAIQAGIGSVVFATPIVAAGSAIEIKLVLRGASAATITGLRFKKHSLFNWSSSNITAIASGSSQPTVRLTPDSVSVVGLTVSATDSVQVRVTGLSAPDTTLKVIFGVETAAGSDSTAPVTPLPSFVLFGNPRPIDAAKTNDAQGVPTNLQQPVTVRGIVTVAQQFGGPAYVQDASGGLAVFDLSFEGAVSIGDEVTLTGTVTQYNGLTELANVTLHKTHSHGNDVIPLVVTVSQIAKDGANGVEDYEGMLVQLNRVTVRDAQGQPMTTWAVSGSGANFWLHAGTDSVQVRIDADVSSLVNQTAPTGEFDIVGVVGQYISTSPYIGGYQLMPRSYADVLSKGPVITVSPLEAKITSSSFDIGWETARPGSSFVKYGRTKSYELGLIGSTVLQTLHTATISGLSPATAYHVQAFSVSGVDTSFTGDRVVSTASQGSSGEVNAYFNKSVNATLASGETANGNANLTDLLVGRINAAQKSIDCALYSISGLPGQTIANALVQAAGRGVKIRFIIERDNMSAGSGTTVNQILIPAGIRVIADDFDAVNAGVGLMHNKFFIIDYRGGAPDKVWVWTGSWNPTDPGTNNDMQNSIEIQDQALAGAYTIEFNEMWGSDTDVPNAANSRFGARKLDNTPHVFAINGTRLELYFSPSDRTTSHIINTLDNAHNSINMALLTLTRSDVATELKQKKDSGVRVRGVLDNGTDTGSQFAFLKSAGVDMLLDPSTNALLHHKYGLVDAELSTAMQYVITGSHNWTSAAETSNNENTLILQSNRIANLYLQEFAARYKDAGGIDKIAVNVERTNDQTPRSFYLAQNYPNPFNGTTNFEFQIAELGFVTMRVYDVLGREVATLVQQEMSPGVYRIRWSADVPSGVYYCALHAGQSGAIRPIVLVK